MSELRKLVASQAHTLGGLGFSLLLIALSKALNASNAIRLPDRSGNFSAEWAVVAGNDNLPRAPLSACFKNSISAAWTAALDRIVCVAGIGSLKSISRCKSGKADVTAGAGVNLNGRLIGETDFALVLSSMLADNGWIEVGTNSTGCESARSAEVTGRSNFLA